MVSVSVNLETAILRSKLALLQQVPPGETQSHVLKSHSRLNWAQYVSVFLSNVLHTLISVSFLSQVV